MPPTYVPTTPGSGATTPTVGPAGPGQGGATTPTAGGPGAGAGGTGTAPTQVPGGGPGLAGIANNITQAAAKEAGTLTEGLTQEQIDQLKEATFTRVWFEKGKAITKVEWSEPKALRGETVKISVKATDYDPDTPVKLSIFAFHSPGHMRDRGVSYRMELVSLETKLDADGAAETDYTFDHDVDAKVKVKASIEDKFKTSTPLMYSVEAPTEESMGTDEELEVELPPEEGSDVTALVGDKVKLMAETEGMPEGAPIKFSLYVDGGAVADSFATVSATVIENKVSSDWQVEYHEDAALRCEGATDFHQLESENKLLVSMEAPDDLSTDEEAGAESAAADTATAEATAAAAAPGPDVAAAAGPGAETAVPDDMAGIDVDDLSSAGPEGEAPKPADETAAKPPEAAEGELPG